MKTHRPLRVVLLSQWAVNPYQALLVARLRECGVSVSEEGPSLRRLLFRDRPHVVHLQNVRPYLTSGRALMCAIRIVHFAARLLLARAAGIRVVWTAHDLKAPGQKHELLDRLATILLARSAHAVIVHGDDARRRFREAARVDERKVHVIPHGNYIGHYTASMTRGEARAILGIGEREVVFLLFGWIKRYKRAVELIRAFRAIAHDDVRLVIAGKAPERAFEDEIRAAAAGDPRIHLHLQSVPDADVQVYMNASDVAVFPYAPVLTSGALVLAESFGKATLVDIGNDSNTDRLTRSLEEAVRNRDRLPEMGERNRRKAAQHDWRTIAEATVELYSTNL